MINRRHVISGVAAAPLLAAASPVLAAGPAPTAGPTIDELLQTPLLIDAAVSPDGQTIAVMRQMVEKDRHALTEEVRTAYLTLRAFDKPGDEVTAKLGDISVEKFAWLDNDRILIWVVWVTGRISVRRLAVFNRATKDLKYLLADTNSDAAYRNTDHGRVVSLLPDETDHIMINMLTAQDGTVALFRIDLRTGVGAQVELGTNRTVDWVIQGGKAVMRTDADGSTRILFGRSPDEKAWKEVRRYYSDTIYRPEFDVMAPSKKPGVLLVAAAADAEDFRPLREFDIATMTWGATVSRQNGDATNCVLDAQGNYVATTYVDDRSAYDCADPQMTAHMTELTGVFSDATLDIRNMSTDRSRMICRVSGPNNAGSYISYDRTAGRIGPVGDVRPWLTPARLPKGRSLSVHSKDGTPIRAYLLTPAGGGRAPMVVMPHGGPELRDMIGFDIYAQTLVSRGWYVLQPNFRGSGGYGKAFANAGRRQWNGLVQEDIEASIAHAIANYPVDAGKVAIFGGSFGGYAAQMSAVRNPTLYKAAISLAGISDLVQILSREREAGVNSLQYQYWRKTIGDADTDTAMLRQASPALRAAEIKAPLLLIHGSADPRVNVEQSRIMSSAMSRVKGVCHYSEVAGMGHGPSTKKDTQDVLQMILDHLDQHLA